MSHLGPRVTALVDGQLAPEAAERALAHLVRCQQCRTAVEAERAARRALSGAADVEPSGDLTDRLLSLAADGGQGPPGRGMAPPGSERGEGRLTGHRGWLLVSAVAGAASATAGLFVIGGLATPGLTGEDVLAGASDATPVAAAVLGAGAVAANSGTVAAETVPEQDGGVEDPVPATTVLRWMATQGWPTPDALPSGLAVVDVRRADDAFIAVELRDGGTRVLLVEARGRLEGAGLATAAPIGPSDVGTPETQAHLVSTDPWSAVVQSGETVVAVVCRGEPAVGRALIEAIPAEPLDSSVAARVGRGWRTLVGAVAGDGGG